MVDRAPFRMPPLPVGHWRLPDGREVPYGERWGPSGPPEHAYSRVTQPERYAPLHGVADALVAHLVAVYDCAASEDATEEHELRAVRVRSVAGTAEIRIAWTDFPGVRARLGSAVEAGAPVCGCDACDEPLAETASELCDHVLATVEGQLRESFSPGRRSESANFPNSSSWTRSSRSRQELRALAGRTPERWAPWPRRAP